MRRIPMLMVLLSCALALLAGCGGAGGAAPTSDVSVTPWIETDQWPDNDFTRAVPEPEAGTVTASMEGTSAGYDFFAVQLDGLSREEVRDYLRAVEEAGYESVTEDLGMEASLEGVTVGDMYCRDGIFLSLAAGDREEDNSLGLLISRPSGGSK